MSIFIILALILVAYLCVKLVQGFLATPAPNPFAEDDRKPVKPKVFDQKQRDAVLKQGFSMSKVPDNLDAIIIGSGIGGMALGALLSKAGKKVLVLEQHDQAGGCCHTFIEKGYEFDVGIHYIGDMIHESYTKTFVDQISDGQITWEPLDENFDEVVFKEPNKEIRSYQMNSKYEKQKEELIKRFPDEKQAIEKYYDLLFECDKNHTSAYVLKFLPMWLVKIVLALNLTKYFTKFFDFNSKTVKETIDGLTDNQELRDVMCYCFGDYGTQPSRAGFPMQATLMTHFMKGRAGYPVNGASEFAFHIIPVIERGGGKVLVRAEVNEIILENGAAKGVRVTHGRNSSELFAPLIVSDAGALNTLTKLLPPELSKSSQIWSVFNKVPQGVGAMSMFVGLDASAEDLDIAEKRNLWVFTKNDIDKAFTDYYMLSADEAEEEDVPLMFISFPSTKDPTWEQKYPGKTTIAIVTLANYEWFKDWEKDPCKRRGDDYEARKKTIGQKLLDHVCDLYPKIKNHIDYVNIGTPVSNNYYLGAQSGEIYGLDHIQSRFNPLNTAILRPKTEIPGLYLTGQDVVSGGFVGGLYGGLMCCQQILGRNIMKDLLKLHEKTKKSD